ADSALQNVVEDTSPELGGALDAGGNLITNVVAIESEAFYAKDPDWRAWQISNGTRLLFASEDVLGGGTYTLRYTMPLNGTPSIDSDVINKGYADANYGGGGSGTTITGAQIVDSLNLELGSTDWQTGGTPTTDASDLTSGTLPDARLSSNALPPTVSQNDAEAGTSTSVYRWTPQRVKQAIDNL